MRRMLTSRSGLFTLLALILVSVSLSTSAITQAHGSHFRNIFGLHVEGNLLKNSTKQTIRLLGVNRSGTEYMCTANAGIFDGPSDAASVDAIASWHVNAVRVPLNEDCWLGINGVNPDYSGWKYRAAIIQFVALLNSRSIIPIIELHWSAPGTTLAVGQRAMPDVDHSITFWKSVANVFKYDSAVVFDLFNEPTVSTWDCWLQGSSAPSTAPCEEVDFAVAGMQTLVDAVRSTGSKNVLMLTGIGYGNWIGYWPKPNDPLNNVMAGMHIYNFSGCTDATCFDEFVAPVAAQVPVTIGELGENDCAHDFSDSVMSWADQHGLGYLGWAWNTYDCSSFPSLIKDFNGTPTDFGVGFKNHFAALDI